MNGATREAKEACRAAPRIRPRKRVAIVSPMRKSRIKKETERAIIYRMVIGIVQRFDATYRQYGRSVTDFSIVEAVARGTPHSVLLPLPLLLVRSGTLPRSRFLA